MQMWVELELEFAMTYVSLNLRRYTKREVFIFFCIVVGELWNSASGTFMSASLRFGVYLTKLGAHLICYPGAFNMSTGELLWELEQRARQVHLSVKTLCEQQIT